MADTKNDVADANEPRELTFMDGCFLLARSASIQRNVAKAICGKTSRWCFRKMRENAADPNGVHIFSDEVYSTLGEVALLKITRSTHAHNDL